MLNTSILTLRAHIIATDIDLIIGRPDIKSQNLVKRFPSQFTIVDNERRVLKRDGLSCEDAHSVETIIDCERASVVPHNITRNRQLHTPLVTVNKDWSNYTSLSLSGREALALSARINSERTRSIQMCIEKHRQQIEVSERLHVLTSRQILNTAKKSIYDREDIEEIPDNRLEAIPADILEDNEESKIAEDVVRLPTNIFGTPLEVMNYLNLLQEFKGQFRTSINPEGAKLPPFQLDINTVEWEKPENQRPPRRIDKVRYYEMQRQINKMISNNILAPSQAAYYSYPLLVPKPNDKWRLCVDYKKLNKISRVERWPIPNIKEMLYRIGDKRPKYFAVLDLTSGYHQIPISLNSRERTAFITPFGLYEWLRLPMGLAGAPSFFQRSISTQVLNGLLMVICDLYLDDLIIYAETHEAFLSNLRTVWERFKQFGLTINPDKCQIGLATVTYVGHTLDATGIHFDRAKLDGVYNFSKPVYSKQLKSFVSLASYFRDHVQNHAILFGKNPTKSGSIMIQGKISKRKEELCAPNASKVDEVTRRNLLMSTGKSTGHQENSDWSQLVQVFRQNSYVQMVDFHSVVINIIHHTVCTLREIPN